MNDIVMPRLSDSMTEGTVVRWLKSVGDQVRRGEPLVEIETDKATLTYESDLDGVLAQIVVGEGQTVPVGAQIAWVEPETVDVVQDHETDPGGAAAQPAPLPLPGDSSPPPLPVEPSGSTPPPAQFAPPPESYEEHAAVPATAEHDLLGQDPVEAGGAASAQQRVKASPIARRLAKRLGVNIAAVKGSGPGGRVVKEDVEAVADAAARAQAASAAPTQALAPEPPEEFAVPAGDGSQHEAFVAEEQFTPSRSHLEEPPPLPVEQQIVPPQPEPVQPEPVQPEPVQPEPVQPEPVQPSPVGLEPIPPEPIEPEPPRPEPLPVPEPSPAPPQEPAFTQQPAVAQQPVQPQAPLQQPIVQPPPQPAFPSPAPFVPGMTGGFPAIQPPAATPPPPPPTPQPQYPYQPDPYHQQQYQQPPPQQPLYAPSPYPQQPGLQQPQAPGAETATRGHATPIEPTTAQQTVARRMAESKATAPEFYVETEVDMTTCVAHREQLRNLVNPLPSFNDFVIKAAAQALRQYPNVNAAYKDGHFEQYSDVNIGIVVSATELLAVPTLFNVDQKGLAQIAVESHQLSEAVRSRTIQPSQMSGGTFSVSNLGMYGVDRFTAILNPPQAAILAVGAINRRAVIAEDGMSLVIRQIMNMTLTCDHRILYGAEAAEFLGAIKAWLESPQLLQL